MVIVKVATILTNKQATALLSKEAISAAVGDDVGNLAILANRHNLGIARRARGKYAYK
jgi:hypothetical protein